MLCLLVCQKRGDCFILRHILTVLLLLLDLCPAAGRAQEIFPEVVLRQATCEGRPVAEIRVNDLLVIRVRTEYGGMDRLTRARMVAQRIRGLTHSLAARIEPAFVGGEVVVRVDQQLIITVDDEVAKLNGSTRTGLAYVWSNHLRQALGEAPLPPPAAAEVIRPKTARPPQSSSRDSGRPLLLQTGTASWYGPGFHGTRTANGEVFNQYELTAAHRTLPFGSRVLVTNLENGKAVAVRINDRGPFIPGRIIDLSFRAAQAISMDGLALVRLEVFR